MSETARGWGWVFQSLIETSRKRTAQGRKSRMTGNEQSPATFLINPPSWVFQPSCCVRSPYSREERPGSLISRPRKWQRSLPIFFAVAMSVAEQCFSFCYPHHPTKLFSLNWGTFSKSTLHFLPEKFIFVTRIALLSQQQLIYFHIKRKSVIGRPIPAEVKRGFCGSGGNGDILKIWKRMKKCFWGLLAKKQQQQQQQQQYK